MSGTHRAAADIEEDPVGLEHLVVDPDRVRALEAGVAADQGAALHAVEPGLRGRRGRRRTISSLRALTFAMSTRDVAVDADAVLGAAARDVRGMRAGDQCLGRDAAVLTQVPPTSLRSITATVWPASVSRPPAGSGLAGADDDRVEFCAIVRGSDEADAERDQESAADGERVLDERDRQVVAAVGGDQLGRAASAPPSVPSTAPMTPAPIELKVWWNALPITAPAKRTGDQSGDELRWHLATRRLRQLVGDQFHRPARSSARRR